MEIISYITIGIAIGSIIGWLISKTRTSALVQTERETAQKKYSELNIDFVTCKATTSSQLQIAKSRIEEQQKEITHS